MSEQLQLRIHGDASLPTLIYLPGLHGDWTLVGAFRKQLIGKVRFVEFIYPRSLAWSLNDYAAAIENSLTQNGIKDGWLLGESYGSQILWVLLARRRLSIQGIILAGGFVRHPWQWGASLIRTVFGKIPLKLLVWLLLSYAKFARIRHRHSPETLKNIDEFIIRRTELDRQAVRHRLNQIARNDPRRIASRTELPVYYLSGWFDPIVPWPLIQNWLKKNCPTLRDCKIIRTADHAVLCNAPMKSATQVLGWMKVT